MATIQPALPNKGMPTTGNKTMPVQPSKIDKNFVPNPMTAAQAQKNLQNRAMMEKIKSGTKKGTIAAPTSPNTGTSPALPSLTPLNTPSYQDVDPFKFDYNYLNYDTAKGRAEERYNPLFEQAVTNVKNEQYQNELNSGTNSAVRGLAHSGLAQDQLTKIAMASQGQIAGLNAQKMADVADYAQNLLDKDLDRGDRLRSQMYNEWSDNRNFKYGQYRDQVGDSQWETSRNDSNYWNQIGQNNIDRDFNRGVFESDRGFNYQTGRDKINDARYADETKYNRGQDAIHNGQIDRQFKSDEYWRNKEWNEMSPSERAKIQAEFEDFKKRAGVNFSYDMKLKKASGGGGGGGGGRSSSSYGSPGVLAQNPGGIPDDVLQDILRSMKGDNSTSVSNYGRGYGTVPKNNSPDSKKARPMAY